MYNFVIKGNICHSIHMDDIETHENAYLVATDGKVEGIFSALPQRFADYLLYDYTDRIVIPGMSDLHIHAPQFSYRGLGMDMELLDWLNVHAFPEEAKFADLDYADRAYSIFVKHLLATPTTRASVFASLHGPATLLLARKMEAAGFHGFVGKVNMDRNSPDYLRESPAPQAQLDTEQWVLEAQKLTNIKPILTPRFIPSCTDELMRGLRALQMKYDLPLQSHVSENLGEIAWVKELCPNSRFYGDAYDQFGLFGGDHPCIMAHCVYSCEEEQELMKRNNVFIAHSPESNMNVSSGVAPINQYLDRGLQVGLATDVAGGSHESMFRAMQHAIQSSKLRWRLVDQSIPALTFDRTFYMATKGGGAFFGKVGSFEPGYELDAVVLDDTDLPHPQPLTLRERLERLVYLSESHAIQAKFIAGRRVL